ncbi:hypothetical protein BOX15_Mlig003876g1 [Macrostomum lignano]|uniref:Ras-associating domain-containing protein n=1 Tax=Macrostomum lignano TaxID=282301 RepID=A0A267F8B9_9PLAT|nr:hypothetical protein BOX15_Mlig003876g1 [Macrostomum lignano]
MRPHPVKGSTVALFPPLAVFLLEHNWHTKALNHIDCSQDDRKLSEEKLQQSKAWSRRLNSEPLNCLQFAVSESKFESFQRRFRLFDMATTISVLSNFSNSRSPEEYPVDASTTASDLVKAVLARHSMLSKDPHLLYVTLDTLGPRGFAESVELDDTSRLLQRLRTARLTSKPSFNHVFVMHMRSGGLLKIHDSCIMPGSFYNSLYVSMETKTTQVIALLLASYGSKELASNFQLVAKDSKGREIRQLMPGEFPLAVQQQHQSRAGGGELSIHLKRAGKIVRSPTYHGQPSGREDSNGPDGGGGGGDNGGRSGNGSEVLSRSETLARLQSSFRELQRLREKNPDLYDKLLVAGQQSDGSQTAQAGKTSSKQSGSKQTGAAAQANQKQKYAVGSSGFLSARQHSVRLGSSSRQRITGTTGAAVGPATEATTGSYSARTTKSSHADRQRKENYTDYWFTGGTDYPEFDRHYEDANFLNRQLRLNRSARGELQQPRQQLIEQMRQQQQQQPAEQAKPQTQKQQSSKRQLPQVPQQSGDSELRVRRLKMEQAAQRQLLLPSSSTGGGVDKATHRKDFQCQTSIPSDEPMHQQQQQNSHQPSLREILSVCETHSCQLTRSSLAQPWGLRWREVQFGDVNGNHRDEASTTGLTKPAIGRRQGAFQRNERLLKYMRTLVAIETAETKDGVNNLSGNGADLRSGDLVIEVNGCLATGLSPEQLDSIIDSQLTLDLLLARQPSSSVSIATGGTAAELSETESGLSDRDDSEQDLRLRLRRLQLQCNELASQCRVHELVIQRLRSQLTKTARVCLLQHTEARPRSHAESERSFQVINASKESPVTSAV